MLVIAVVRLEQTAKEAEEELDVLGSANAWL